MMKYKILTVLLIGLIFGALLAMSGLVKAKEPEPSSSIEAQATIGTALSYQGRLNDGGSPANGVYDFEFKLYDNPTEGTQIGSTLTQSDAQVDNGVFTVFLDFGDVFNGEQPYLEVGVRPSSVGSSFTVLNPRQTPSPVPYALWAKNSGSESGGEIWRLASSHEWYDWDSTWDGSYKSVPVRVGTGTGDPLDGPPSVAVYFTPPSTQKTIKSVKFLISDKTDYSYNGDVIGKLEIRNLTGDLQQTLVSNINFKTEPAGVWKTLTLPGNPVISPDEFLVFNIDGNGDSGTFTFGFDSEVKVE